MSFVFIDHHSTQRGVHPFGRKEKRLVHDWSQFPIAFFDRDGTLIKNLPYNGDPEKIFWIDGAVDACKHLTAHGWLVGIVSNQSGIARGYLEDTEVHAFHNEMRRQFYDKGGHFDFIEFCPHMANSHPDRKPNPGMILRILRELNGDRERSFLIGDSESDLRAAKAGGIPGFRYDGSERLDRMVCKIVTEILERSEHRR